MKRYRDNNPWQGFILGALGGIAGIFAMQYYWQIVTALNNGQDPRKQPKPEGQTDDFDNVSLIGRQHEPGESSTAALGRHAYRLVTGRNPATEETKTLLSNLTHWLISMGAAGLYGAIQGEDPAGDIDGGATLGTALWLLGDETFVALTGLADGPTAYPPQLHAHSLGAHLAYGIATSLATQFLYRLTD